MVFSTNQNRHLYVCKSFKNEGALVNIGDLGLGINEPDGNNPKMYIKYMGSQGDLKAGGIQVRSDLIPTKSISYLKLTEAAKLQRKLKQACISLDPAVNGGNPILGQDYIVRIQINNYVGLGDCNRLDKFGAVKAIGPAMTKAGFYEALAKSLTGSFKREVVPLLEFEATATGVIVKEVEQPWRLGLIQQTFVNFSIYAEPVTFNGIEMGWAATDDKGFIAITDNDDADPVGNGKMIADLEYFCMGERGDRFKMHGWPYVIYTDYQVDPNKEYDVIDIHFDFTGDGVSSYKSEKDITIVVEKGGGSAIATAIATLSGACLTVDK